jgi:hypothetical protein
MIAGQAPKFEWRKNADGEERTISQGIELARKWGVAVPDYVSFSVDKWGRLGSDTTAKTTTFREPEGTIIYWLWLFHRLTGKIPFLVRRDIMFRDEAIVAVIGHEMFELEKLRPYLERGWSIENLRAETSADYPDNFHCEAWDYADELVRRMRGIYDDE